MSSNSNSISETQDLSKQSLVFVVNSVHTFISHRLPLALAAKQAGIKVDVLSPSKEGQDLLKEYELPHHVLSMSRSSLAPKQEIKSIYHAYRLIKKLDPTVIHTVSVKPVVYVGVLNRFIFKKQCISAVVGLGYAFNQKGLKGSIYRKLWLKLYRLSLNSARHTVIFQNRDDRQFFIENELVAKQQTTLMKGAGVCLHTFYPIPEPKGETIKIVLPARMLWDKGVGEFVKVAQKCHEAGVNAEFILAGGIDFDNRAHISKQQLLEWCQLPNLTWLGHQEVMTTLFQNCHIVCLPSYREGMPKALLEAAACGKPVVTTNVPGCREAIIDNKTGLLVPAKAVDPLYEALMQLINDATLRRSMGHAAINLAKQDYDIKHVIRSTLALYSELPTHI